MPDYTVLVRVTVREAKDPLDAARKAQCYLTDELPSQTLVVQDDLDVVLDKFSWSELDEEFETPLFQKSTVS